ncbi:xanthine dehydrogenase FAD-binding subunit XdhB [Candidatus Formimonas warabiya]|uniref:Xanthine dehydrogenase FAD-binding subunit XdhB n=1 Tax=Formimonas warabiya TaxID=1761012 RepID=A0A3G1KQW2_FORW1|nr:xanthine dehydrogenase FAD-binding subunit XdhB [Candidatus Formimonas warabiya]ATW24848.1 xanthine dehydrogenase FAD-binding subunit XdhB [Candidatus Formimonas warabiya]
MFGFSQLYEPSDLQEAWEFLNNDRTAKIIAGGTDILLKFRHKEISDIPLVSLKRIKSLKEIKELPNGSVQIGAMATFTQVNKDPIINDQLPFLAKAAITMGGPQIQNVATIGGNLCNGATSADSASSLLTLKAKLTLQSLHGTRVVDMEKFYQGLYQTDIQHGEILTAVSIPKINGLWGGHYTKFSMRKAMDISTLGCAVVCLLKDQKTIGEIRIALGTAAPMPIRCYQAENVALGQNLTDQLLVKVGIEAVKEAKPRSSWRASREFREELIKELTSRTLLEAFFQAGGKRS